MAFDITTFALEIVNFLVLVWILQRLFYKPVLAVIARRKQHIEQTLTEARQLREQAEELQHRYENRQSHWDREKQEALNALHRDIDQERQKQMERLQQELEQERQKAKVTLNRLQRDIRQQAERKALQNGARFAGLLLRQGAGPDLEARLCDLLVEQFTVLPEDCKLCLQTLEARKSVAIHITSAYPLASEMKQKLENKLGELINRRDLFHYHHDAELIAGLRIDIGDWVLQANVQHELAGFAEIAHEPE